MEKKKNQKHALHAVSRYFQIILNLNQVNVRTKHDLTEHVFTEISDLSITVFNRSNAGIVGSNPTQGTNICVRLFCVCVVLCVGSGLGKS
jgi:hypothetical protein